MGPSMPLCKQCGTYHPPLPPGEKCPNATKEDVGNGKVVDFNELFSPLRNILLSKIQGKGIKNTKKLFGATIVEITKFLENYKE